MRRLIVVSMISGCLRHSDVVCYSSACNGASHNGSRARRRKTRALATRSSREHRSLHLGGDLAQRTGLLKASSTAAAAKICVVSSRPSRKTHVSRETDLALFVYYVQSCAVVTPTMLSHGRKKTSGHLLLKVRRRKKCFENFPNLGKVPLVNCKS